MDKTAFYKEQILKSAEIKEPSKSFSLEDAGKIAKKLKINSKENIKSHVL